jgi:hypothetical protein
MKQSSKHIKEETMNFNVWIKKGLLGYQPIFFPNGLISGTGFQFFGNLRSMRASVPEVERPENSSETSNSQGIKVNASFNFNQGRLGNLYVPPTFGDRSQFDTEFYYCVDEGDVEHFARYNLALLEMYEYFAAKAMDISRDSGCQLSSMIEIGSNTCLFPLAFSKAGISRCHGADIVDHAEVVSLLAAIRNVEISFHHMTDDSDETWKNLPKADLVWSYAVLLHQSNPLAHLTRLASLARKAIFVMTLCDPEDWKSEQEMSIRYLSANSYYNAEFPNCFDVTIVSPALIKYSLERLGFSRIVEISHPDFDLLDDTSRADLKYWLKKHCFFLAFRDEVKDDQALNDYSVAAERSPYRGDNVLVYSGHHNNVVLSQSRYYIVPHGDHFVGDGTDSHLQSFSTLTIAMNCLNNLDTEKNPTPLLVRALKKHNMIRFMKRIYLCPHGQNVKFHCPKELENLHSLDSLDKWDELLGIVEESNAASLSGVLVDIVGQMPIMRTGSGKYSLVPLLMGKPRSNEEVVIRAASAAEAVTKVHVSNMLEEFRKHGENDGSAVFTMHERSLYPLVAGGFQIRRNDSSEVVSTHSTLEDAWRALLLAVK